MKVSYHVIIASAAALALVPVLGARSSLFAVSSVLIDVDHYLDYVYRNGFRDFSLRRAVEFNRVLNEKASGGPFVVLHIFHTVEFMGVLAAIAIIFKNPWFWAILWGVLLHIGLDLIYVYYRRVLFRRALSVIEYFIRYRMIKRRGKHLEMTYRSVLQTLFKEGV